MSEISAILLLSAVAILSGGAALWSMIYRHQNSMPAGEVKN